MLLTEDTRCGAVTAWQEKYTCTTYIPLSQAQRKPPLLSCSNDGQLSSVNALVHSESETMAPRVGFKNASDN